MCSFAYVYQHLCVPIFGYYCLCISVYLTAAIELVCMCVCVKYLFMPVCLCSSGYAYFLLAAWIIISIWQTLELCLHNSVSQDLCIPRFLCPGVCGFYGMLWSSNCMSLISSKSMRANFQLCNTSLGHKFYQSLCFSTNQATSLGIPIWYGIPYLWPCLHVPYLYI